ncbi:MAG: VOC family protein [Anaerolineae bacterium]
MVWKQVVPMLQVNDVNETIAYYREALGFVLGLVWPNASDPRYATVSRGEITFAFTIDLGTSEGNFIAEKGNGVVLYLLVEDVDAAYEELSSRGAIIVQDLVEFAGRRQFSVGDINGYMLAVSEA